ncbi:MAG: phytanoyl-CoA dioxygenase family protein [Brevundimonas sp.]
MRSISERLLPDVPVVESLLFEASLDNLGLTNLERDVAVQLDEKDFAVFDSPDDDLDAHIERIKADLTPRVRFDRWREAGWARNEGLRIQDGWTTHEDIRAIAANAAVIELLSKLYGRQAFPFQTLNFPVGTQQHFHSDSIHFSSISERFMCGVWLALEDIHPDVGPLAYYLGSHEWPIVYNAMIGRRVCSNRAGRAQGAYEDVWQALVEALDVKLEVFCAKKGQALIWAANLLHGGSRQINPELTRWSQVTHYYFAGCSYHTLAFSDQLAGNLDLRQITNAASGHAVPNVCVDTSLETLLQGGPSPADAVTLPPEFDEADYLALNADIPGGPGATTSPTATWKTGAGDSAHGCGCP